MPNGIPSLAEHLASVEQQGSELRRRTTRAARAFRAEDRELMARHADVIARHYEGVEADIAFVEGSGAVYDAVPVEQQAAFRLSGEAAPAAPRGLPGTGASPPGGRELRGFAGEPDRFGNPRRSPKGTVPLRRETMEDAVLWRGHRKYAPMSDGGESDATRPATYPAAPGATVPAALAEGTNQHKYVLLTMRTTPNRGGYAHHSAQRVPIDGTKGEVFSLTQQWYILGTESWNNFNSGQASSPPTDPMLTVEFGMHSLPRVFGTPGPTLWVGSTNNGYNFEATNGGFQYNTRPGSGFVQTNADWGLGMDLSPFSALGGPQYYLGMGAQLEGDRWWVYFGGGSPEDAVGYWPASWWIADGAPNGATMATRAGCCEWGAETSSVSLADGTMHYPPMGHRAPASQGWRRAAYIRNMVYYGTDGATRAVPATTTVSNVANLQPGQSAARHTPDLGLYGASYGYKEPWSRTLWFGGPGAVLDSNTGVITVRPNPA